MHELQKVDFVQKTYLFISQNKQGIDLDPFHYFSFIIEDASSG